MNTPEIPDALLELRHTYRACMHLAEQTDSKREEKTLRAEAKEALEKLRATCPHDMVLCLRSEFGGSRACDYDDRHAEERVCIVCGVTDSAYSQKFTVLSATPCGRFESNAPAVCQRPLEALVADILQTAWDKGYVY